MNRLSNYFLATLTTFYICFSLRAEMKVARINDKDGFTNIREGQGAEFKIVGTLTAEDFFYCEQSNSDWWKASAIKLNDRGQQIEGYIFKDKVQFLSTLPDTTKRKLIQTVFETHKQLATNFQNAWKSKDSLAYRTTRSALENYSDSKYDPILDIFPNYFCKTLDSITLNLFFAAIWTDNGSANEMPSFAIGDCFVCHADVVLRQLKSVKDNEQLKLIVHDIEWGLRNHFNVSEPGDANPATTTQKDIDNFNKLLAKLKTIRL